MRLSSGQCRLNSFEIPRSESLSRRCFTIHRPGQLTARLAKGRAPARGVSPAGLRLVIASSPSLVYNGCAWIPSGASAETCGAGAPCSILPLAYWRAKLNDEARLLMQFAPDTSSGHCKIREASTRERRFVPCCAGIAAYSNSSGLPASNDGKAFRISVKCFRIALSAPSGSRRSIASRIALCWSMSVVIDSVLLSVR
jgi:hypothetical protein